MAPESPTFSAMDIQQLRQSVIDAKGAEIVVAGAKIARPTIPESPPESFFLGESTVDYAEADQPDDRLVVAGQVRLFGQQNRLVDFFSYHGPAPNGETTAKDGSPVVYQIAAFPHGESVTLPELVPASQHTAFENITFKNLQFVNQNIKVDEKKGLGLTLEADIILDERYGEVHDVLDKFFGVSDSPLRATCGLGVQDWNEAPEVSTVELVGEFTGRKPDSPIKMLDVHKVGVRLELSNIGQENPTYSWTISGELSLSLIPIPFTFEISKPERSASTSQDKSEVSLTLALNGNWKHAFSIPNLQLEHLILSTTFNAKDAISCLDFDIHALANIGSCAAAFGGRYSADGYSLKATLAQFSFSALNDIYNQIYSNNLVDSGPKIEFGSATFSITGNKDGTDFKLEVHESSLDGHSVPKVEAVLGSKGVTFDFDFDFEENITYTCGKHTVKIDNPRVHIDFVADRTSEDGTVTKGTADVSIKGAIEWASRKYPANLHLYSGPDGITEYTILAEFKDQEDGSDDCLSVARVIPALGKTFLDDVTLRSAGLIIASRNDPQLGNLGIPCDLIQGFQVYAVLGEVKQVNAVTSNPQRLVLRAAWDNGFSDRLDIFCDAPHIDFGRGIVAKEIDLEIRGMLAGNPQLCISGGLLIPVNHQTTPLEFDMTLTLGDDNASVEGSLACSDGWNDPFGLYDKLTIDLVALEIGINYERFAMTGPSPVGFSGSFLIDTVSVDTTFRVEDNPANEILAAEVKDLTLSNVVNFTRTLTNLPLPTPPNVVDFKDIKVYVTPVGTTLKNVKYPPGLLFDTDVALFGIEGKAMVTIGNSGVNCSGSITPFALGPLSVYGMTPGTAASLALCLTEDRHYGHINGSTSFFGSTSAISLNLEMYPSLTFDFSIMLQFAKIFDLKVDATKAMAISPSDTNVTVGDYMLKAQFNQEIRDYVSRKINDLFKEKARLAAQSAAEREREIATERKRLRDRIDAKQANLDMALKTKNELINEKKEALNKDLDVQKAVEHQKLTALTQAQLDLRAQTEAAKNDVAAKTIKAKKDLADAQQNLDHNKQDWDANITALHRVVDGASQYLHKTFNNAENSLEAARDRVKSLEAQLDKINCRIRHCKDAHWYDLPAKAAIPGLELEKAGLEVAMATANRACSIAEEIIDTDHHNFAVGAVEEAHKKLAEGQATYDRVIKASENELEAAKEELKGLDGALEKELDNIDKAFSGAIEVAKRELQVAQNAVTVLEKDLISVETSLESSTEFVAYRAAEDALRMAKASGSAVLTLADAGAKAHNSADQELLGVWDAFLSNIGKLVDITEVTITGELGKAVKGDFAFDAKVSGTFNGKEQWTFDLKYDPNAAEKFLKGVFDQLVKRIEAGVIEPMKQIFIAAGGGTVEVGYKPNGTYTIKHV